MIIWRRWGVLAPVLAFVILIATQASIDGIHGAGTYTANGWAKALALILGGLAVGGLGYFLNARAKAAQEATHTFFFIPMEIWGGLLVGMGIYSFF